VPTSALSVLIFLIFIAPGFYYELVSGRRRVRASESTFKEVSRALVASVALGVPAACVALLSWWLVTDFNLPDFTSLIKRDAPYLGTHFWSLSVSIVGYLAASVGLTHVVERLVRKDNSPAINTAHSLWTELFKTKVPVGRKPLVKVVMHSGNVWFGPVGRYSADHELSDREVVLFTPIHFSETQGGRLTPVAHTAIILRGSEIASIAVDYPLTDAPEG
jgi:hypothetical protein